MITANSPLQQLSPNVLAGAGLLFDIAAVFGDAKEGTVCISITAALSLSVHMLFNVNRIYLQDLFVSHISKDATSLTLYLMRYKIYLNPVHILLNTCCLCKILFSLLEICVV